MASVRLIIQQRKKSILACLANILTIHIHSFWGRFKNYLKIFQLCEKALRIK